jgi:drug/metabolite transporter (DMT)-like permease
VPLFATAVAALLHRKWPPAMVVAGVAAGLFGGVLMAWPGLGVGGSSALGVALVIAACISYGFAVNLARPLQQRNGALPVIWRALFVGLVLTAPLGLPRALAAQWSPRAALSLLALGALGTCVATVMTTVASGRLGATSASVSAYFIPVVALILGVAVRHEHVAAISIAGGAVSLAAAWVVRWASIRAAAAAAAPAGVSAAPAK